MSDSFFNPYVGLRPFQEEENLLFFGRDEQTLELLQRLHANRFVAVVGSSGSGKSSLIRAGLIPALKGGFLVENSSQWLIAIMKPGQNPVYNLAATILNQIDPNITTAQIQAFVIRIKKEGASAILDVIEPLRENKNSNFFLLVDQFEELFRFSLKQKDAAFKTEAIDFVNLILKLSEQKQIPFYVVLTMRSDFIGDCAEFFGLPEALNKSQYLVPRLNRFELKKVIEGPAKLYGGKFNAALTSQLINDLGEVKDELPLVQHALMRMWTHKYPASAHGELDLQDYNDIGGIENALSVHANEALNELSPDEQALAKVLFQALTTIDENGRKIRRPAKLSDLRELTGASEEKLLKIINNFIRNNRSFLVLTNIGDSTDKLIDISHESLIRHWKNLNNWVDEESEAAIHYKHLCDAYNAHREDRKDLLSGREFEITQEWFEKFRPNKIWAARYNEHFPEATKYLADSAKIHNAKKRNARRLRRVKKISRYTIVSLAFIGLFTYFIFQPSMEQLDWRTAVSENNEEAYSTYLEAHPKGEYAEIAQNFLDSTMLQQAWQLASKENTVKAYQKYLNVAATEKDSLNNILGYSKFAKDTLVALERIESLKDRMANSNLDETAWNTAQEKNSLASYLRYIKNDSILGTHDDDAYKKIQEIGKNGFLYSGRSSANKIPNSIFKIIYRKDSAFNSNDIPQPNDIVKANENRYIYKDINVNNKSGNSIRIGDIYLIKSVNLQANAVFVEILYEP
ncbi:hypothetical protein QRD02_04190 [Aequorivita sp. SDUM287046]|uniref:Novel STAND NTPase 1 domain-containing protein n=1 Tax=Aequorivita aurantiaca TaxID=3053356 RepID=A0ABT8DE56_9FLAO|nr:hypothetical protein [Aequorivita aurantiaca]MDN3723570.1 hypothetical protein [Aequorivita aurantiaca]